MSKLSKNTQQRIVISLTSESAGKELIDAIGGGKVLSGNVAPDDSLGENGDLYINITNGDLYKKYNDSWSLQESGGGGDFANKDLSNLTPTAIPAGVNLESLSTNQSTTTAFSLRTKDQTVSDSGRVIVRTGAVNGNFRSGGISIDTGAANNSLGNSNTDIMTGILLVSTGRITGGTLGTTGNATFRTGDLNILPSIASYSGNTGVANLSSGAITCNSGTTVTGGSGFVGIGSGPLFATTSSSSIIGNSGNVQIRSGHLYANVVGAAITGNSGSSGIRSGDIYGTGTSTSNTGEVFLVSGDVLNLNNTGNTGNVNIYSGNNSGTGDSGNITLLTGNKEGSGIRGYISLAASYINANLAQIKNVADATDVNDAVNLSQLETITNDLEDRVVSLEDNSSVSKVYAYEDNLQVRADGQPGIKDPSSLIRDGWYYKNLVAGQKINWYYFDGLNQGTVTLGDLKSVYAVMTFDAVRVPVLAIYTVPTGVGDALPPFAHSRIVYDATMTPTPVIGKKYLVYGGEEPSVHPELPRIQLTLVPAQSVGEKLPTEQILTVSFGSDSGASVNSVQYMVETLGLFSDPVKHEMDLRIRVGSQLELDNKANKDLSNLVTTSIPAGVNLESLATNVPGSANPTNSFTIRTKDQTATTSGTMLIKTGDTSGNNKTGNMNLWTGDGGGTEPTGSIYVWAGYNNSTGAGGTVHIYSGDSLLGNSGDINIITGSAGAVRGKVRVTGREVDVSNVKIVNLSNGTANNDAVNVSQLNSTIASSFEDIEQPVGLKDPTQVALSIDDSLRTLTVAPTGASFVCFVKGKKITISSSLQSTWPNTPGLHFFYIDQTGSLITTTTFTDTIITEYSFVSMVYWDDVAAKHIIFANEKHGMKMSPITHAYLHRTRGAAFDSGGKLVNFVVDGGGSSDTHAQFTSNLGVIWDEDIRISYSAQAQIPVFYKSGASGLWKRKEANSFPLIISGEEGYTGASGLIPYNNFNGSSWVLSEASNNKFVLVHIFATNDIEFPVIAIQGQVEYNNKTTARRGALTEIRELSGLPVYEFCPLGSVIYQTSNSYTNTPKVQIVSTADGDNYEDHRLDSIRPGSLA
jgi:hypothetical protein